MDERKSGGLGIVLAALGNLAHVVAAVAVTYAALLGAREFRAAHEQRGVETLWRLHEKLASETMRAQLGALPKIHRPVTVEVLSGGDDQGEVLRAVANFYEMVAMSVHKGYMSYADVDGYIGNDVVTFWTGVEDAVRRVRDSEHRPQAYAELEWLVARLKQQRGYPAQQTGDAAH